MESRQFTFSEIVYERPDFEEIGRKAEGLAGRIEEAASYEEVKVCLEEMEKVSKSLETVTTVAFIRHTLDAKDEFYDKENEYINHRMPEVMPKLLLAKEALMKSPFRAEIEREFGRQMFAAMELEKKTFCEENIPLMQKEAQLTSEYEKMMAGAQIPFHGEEKNLYGIQELFGHADRKVRAEAYRAYSEFYRENEKRMEEIWDGLISLRTQMAKNLGYENFIPVGYMQQGRTDYGQEEVEGFRAQVRKYMVPLCEKLYEEQRKRLGVDTLMAYDEKWVFPDGNAIPAGDEDFMIQKAQKMYHDLSTETGEFIDFMIGHGLMDLKNKPGKASTGYMAALPDYLAPFVFACMNHTIFDMQVLTHELGHAFAAYQAMRTQPLSAYYSVSTDIAEIHSMSMEQFTYRYAEMFFGDQADKYRFAHLQEAVMLVPFGTAVDEFQHICYKNPSLTPKERTLAWKKLEEIYMPWRKYDADDFFDRGGFWYHKQHIFLFPFYYINYVLTTMGAMEFAVKNAGNRSKAWEDYLKLCRCGGSMGYLETLKHAGLSSPFAKGSVERAAAYVEGELGRGIC